MSKTKLTITLSAIALCLMMIFSCFSASAKVFYGDVDADTYLTVIDATLIQQHLASLTNLTDEQQKVATVSGNENLSVIDATLIQQKCAEIIEKFPVEEENDVNPTEKETLTKVSKNINVYFSNNKNWTKVYAYIYNSATGQPKSAWPGELLSNAIINDYGESVYAINADTEKFDRIIFSNGTYQTTDTPLSVCNSGYFIISPRRINGKYVTGVYPYGQNSEGTIKYVNLEYSKGYNKEITIWTPVGYDPADKDKKYSVLYMTDGQNIFGDKNTMSGYEWEVDETVLSYMQNGGDGIIVVGIDNSNAKRDSELTPDLGDIAPEVKKQYGTAFDNGTGKAYSDFVVEKVIPYIDANYNTNSIRGIIGSSSGGIESFYIGMENMDKFDYIGAISPAFLLYDKATWDEYLSKFDFSDSSKLPRIYFFNGNSPNDALEQELYPNAVAMQGWMEKKGYDSSLMKTVVDNDGTHSELFWEVWFPEALAFGLGY